MNPTKIAFRSKNEVVYQQLHKFIITGVYKPGSRLVIDQVAAEIGVSQIPVREAVRQLEADGFVTIEPYTGATVTEINANLIYEIFALLENLEVFCSRSACDQLTDEQINEITALVQKMDASVSDPEKWSEQNKEFHLLIGSYSMSTLANGMLRKVLDHWDRLRFHYLKDVLGVRTREAQQEHHQIIEAMRERNKDKVEVLVHQHNQNALASYLAYLRSTGQIVETPADE
jgi:DNA-binding GntR family transcriptional regulator